MKIIEKYKKIHIFFRLIINGIVLYTLWILFYKIIKNFYVVDFFYEKIIFYFSVLQLKISGFVLKIFGYDYFIIGKIIKIPGSFGVHLDKGCLGRNTIGLFAGFLLAFPGLFRSKLWFIPLGIGIFVILNILRITSLAIMDFCCQYYLDFNHHYTFKIIIYVTMFILWTVWIRKYSELASKQKRNK